jgi:hypothetical protein
MTRQLGLFDAPPRPVVPADPGLTARERKRLGPDCTTILHRLREGPVTATELIPITHRFSARIWDLRAAGCSIRTDHDRKTGRTVFTLHHEPEGLT